MLDVRDKALRLPGVLCETRLPNLGSRPLRLDVAGFVGLAERGPLDRPVMVEDFSQYRLIFGGELPVARYEGRPLFAHLPRTVEAFFENGGRRCYIVRVAGEGNRANHFQLPGLLAPDGDGNWQPVVVPAAWPGRWSELVGVATTLRQQPLAIRDDDGPLTIESADLVNGRFTLPLRLPAPDALQQGELLRLHLSHIGGADFYHYVRVGVVVQESGGPSSQLFGIPVNVGPIAEGRHLFQVNPAVVVPTTVARLTPSGWRNLPFAAGDYRWSDTGDAGVYRLTMPLDDAIKVDVGTLFSIAGPADEPPLFFTAERVLRQPDPAAGDEIRLTLDDATPLQMMATFPAGSHTVTQVDRLGFDLLLREGETVFESWADLRFGTGANGWASILQPTIPATQIDPHSFTVDDFGGRSLFLGAGETPGTVMPLPIGMSALATFKGPRTAYVATGQDGLDTFDPRHLFIDDDFRLVGVRHLLTVANDRLHLAATPRRLRGLHSLLPLEEVALIAAPDLVHLGWEAVAPPPFTEPEIEPVEPDPPQGFHDCRSGVAIGDEADDPDVAPVIMLNIGDVAVDPSYQAWLENLPEQLAPADHDDAAFLDVQRVLIRLCAARADVIALLSIPHHYDGRLASQWQRALTTTPDFYDGDPLSYAAVYHGWPAIREPMTPELAPLRYLPPDGAVAGMIAGRELRRGAWIAPANVTLQNVADLRPEIGDGTWASLFERQINIIRRQPGRYTLLSALTLARERSLRQINVRRLLILLRKIALREGQRYVFESNNARFRALVQTSFENILNQILERGGLHAFQVVTNEEVNTANDYDNGRFIIALKVAPTLPIEFITITMLRSGADAVTILET